MPILIDDQVIAAGFLRCVDGFLHRAEEEIRADYRPEFAVRAVHRQRAYQAQFPGVRVRFHVRENQFPCFSRLLVPESAACVVAQRGSVLVEPAGSAAADRQKRPFRQCHICIVRVEGIAHGDHQVRHVGDQADCVLQFRIVRVHVVGQDHLGHQPPVVGRIWTGPRFRVIFFRCCEKAGGVVTQQHHARLGILEYLVRDHGFLVRPPQQVVPDHPRHFLFRGFRDVGPLLQGNLGIQLRQLRVLVSRCQEKGCGKQRHGDQDQKKNLIPDTPENHPSDSTHYQLSLLCISFIDPKLNCPPGTLHPEKRSESQIMNSELLSLPAIDQFLKLTRRQRPREIIPLHQIAPGFLQQFQLLLGLHALCHNRHLQVPGNIKNQLHQMEIPLVPLDVPDKGNVHLQHVHRQ